MNLAVIIIALQGIVSITTSSKTECPVDNLPKHDSIQCHVSNDIESDNEGRTKTENTTCLILQKDSLHYFTCKDGMWKDTNLENYQGVNKVYRTEKINTHHTRHKRDFWSSIGNFFKEVVTGVVCVLSLFTECDIFGARSGPSPDNTPPVIYNCPATIYAIAKPTQTYAVVVWEEPTAHDDRNGDITPVRHGRGPHDSFSEERSPHHIKYIVKDNSGNTAECIVTINISVIRCLKLAKINNGYYTCHPSTDCVLGTSCSFGCYQGFELDGVSHITCTDKTIWTNSAPICKPITCQPLSPIEGAILACTNGTLFRSVCSFNCDVGYDMPPEVSKALVCQSDKTWRKHGEPKCIDIEAPSFNTCPSIVIRGTDVGRTKGQLLWNEPTVGDNSGEVITANQSSNSPKLGSYQLAGTYVISYTASDAEGNKARDCVFKVVIRDSRCPKLYPSPYMQISCPHGYRTGAICNMSCDPGKVRVGKPHVKCEEASGGLSGNWNWGSQRTFCNVTNTCVQLKPPKNGALACDNWLGGVLCQYQCKEKYDSFTDWKKLTVCQKSGNWRPHIEPFNCVQIDTRRDNQHTHVDTTAEYYFSGDCTNATTKTEIQQNFVTALNTSLWSMACFNDTNCNVDNVQVNCGSSSQNRQRRDASIDPIKRASDDYNEISFVTVNTRIAIELSVNVSFNDIQTKYIGVISELETILSDVVTDQSLLKFNTSFNGVTNEGLKLDCPEGSIPATNSFSCILCPEGSYYNTSSRLCLPCKKATYQDELGQLQCKHCPLTKTTHTSGSSDYGDCEDACEPGTLSSDGIVPCSLCEVGYYQNMYGQTDCVRCHGSMSTLSFGSTDIKNCHEFDIELPMHFMKKISLQLQEDIVIEDFFVSVWIQRMNINSTALNLSLLSSYGTPIVMLENMMFVNVHQESGLNANYTLDDERWHKWLISIQGCILTVTVDGQVTLESKLTSFCQQTLFLREVIIDAGEEFVGGISQLNIGTNIFSIIADEQRCFNIDLPEILSWYEFGAANLTGAFIRAPSECDDFDNCMSTPCYNGSCRDAMNSFVCECLSGFTGIQCEINIDDCSSNICMNNASCIDGVHYYSCLCAENYTGTFCEIEMVHGGFGTWSNWSECSTTCGQGEHKRIRFCDSPVPDNGGRECLGNSSDYTPCNNAECPECPSISPPDNGTIACSNDSGSLNCTIMCNPGFDFDIEPLDYYFCGPETFHEWNFQTVINPFHRLPECTAIIMPNQVSVQYSAKYRDLYCTRSREVAVKDFINNQTDKVVQNIPCIKSKICLLEGVEIHNCGGLKRRKRAPETVVFQLALSVVPGIDANGTDTLDSLQEAFILIQEAADKGKFTLTLQGDDYVLDRNLTAVKGQAICPPGFTRVHFYCVPCGKGSMLYTDYCKKCDIGFYQNMEGQTLCFQCPKGRTTLGIGSNATDDCSVHLEPIPDGKELMAILFGCSFGVATILLISIVMYRRKRCRQKRKYSTNKARRSESSASTNCAPISSIALRSNSFTLVSSPVSFITPGPGSTASVTSFQVPCNTTRSDSTVL